VLRDRESSGKPSATVADAMPLAPSRLSRTRRMRSWILSSATPSNFNGADESHSNPSVPVAVTRTRARAMALRTIPREMSAQAEACALRRS
jgi:hypothetical protein